MEDSKSVGVYKIEVLFRNGAATEKYITVHNTKMEFDKEKITKRFIRDRKILLTAAKNVSYVSHKIISKIGI